MCIELFEVLDLLQDLELNVKLESLSLYDIEDLGVLFDRIREK